MNGGSGISSTLVAGAGICACLVSGFAGKRRARCPSGAKTLLWEDRPVTEMRWYAVDEIGNDNFATSIYETGDKGLLVARCNQNGQYPWQGAAIIRGLQQNKSLPLSPAERDAK